MTIEIAASEKVEVTPTELGAKVALVLLDEVYAVYWDEVTGKITSGVESLDGDDVLPQTRRAGLWTLAALVAEAQRFLDEKRQMARFAALIKNEVE